MPRLTGSRASGCYWFERADDCTLADRRTVGGFSVPTEKPGSSERCGGSRHHGRRPPVPNSLWRKSKIPKDHPSTGIGLAIAKRFLAEGALESPPSSPSSALPVVAPRLRPSSLRSCARLDGRCRLHSMAARIFPPYMDRMTSERPWSAQCPPAREARFTERSRNRGPARPAARP